MIYAFGEAYLGEHAPRQPPLSCRPQPAMHQRHTDIFHHVETGDEFGVLKHETDGPAQCIALGSILPSHSAARKAQLTAIHTGELRKHV